MNIISITTLLLMCSTYASAAMPAEGDSTTAGNQAMRVVTFKAVPGTERTYYYHRYHLRFSLQRMKPKDFLTELF